MANRSHRGSPEGDRIKREAAPVPPGTWNEQNVWVSTAQAHRRLGHVAVVVNLNAHVAAGVLRVHLEQRVCQVVVALHVGQQPGLDGDGRRRDLGTSAPP